jgi:predicted amidophosphoribosyltransferase
MVESCIECGNKLKTSEVREGFCTKCQAKINHDFNISDEIFDEKELFFENIFES